MLSADLASLYRVPTSRLHQAVKRNRTRFPEDFMFQLTVEETVALNAPFAFSDEGRHGRYTIPLAFTELGIAMLAAVLRSDRAVEASIAILRELEGAGLSDCAARIGPQSASFKRLARIA